MRRRCNLIGWAGIALLTAAGYASGGLAQAPVEDATRAAARELGERGLEAYWADDFATADAKLDQAYRLYAVPTLGLWSARARARLDRWVEAAERYREAARNSDAADNASQKRAQREALKELDELLPRIPSITLQLVQTGRSMIRLSLDGSDIPAAMIGARRPTNPGKHTLVVTRGSDRQELAFELLERQHKLLPIELPEREARAPAPASAPTAHREAPASAAPVGPEAKPKSRSESMPLVQVVAITALAVGGVSLVVGGATALSANRVLQEDCPRNVCQNPADKKHYETLKATSTVTLYAGAALAVGGLGTLLLYRSPNTERSRDLAWSVSPTGASIQGSF